MQGGEVSVHDKDSRSQVLSQLAATEASFDFSIENNFIHINYSNLSEVTISFFGTFLSFSFSVLSCSYYLFLFPYPFPFPFLFSRSFFPFPFLVFS